MWVNTFQRQPFECELVNLDMVQNIYVCDGDSGFRVVAQYPSGTRVELTESLSEEEAKQVFLDICEGLRTGHGYLHLQPNSDANLHLEVG